MMAQPMTSSHLVVLLLLARCRAGSNPEDDEPIAWPAERRDGTDGRATVWSGAEGGGGLGWIPLRAAADGGAARAAPPAPLDARAAAARGDNATRLWVGLVAPPGLGGACGATVFS